MVFEDLLEAIGREPVFETGFLLAGAQNPAYIRRQLADWVRDGKLWQLRRGLYAPAPPYQKVPPHPFLVANRLVAGSYVSQQSALAYYDLIPEYVPAVTSITARRPGRWATPVGEMIFKSLRRDLIFGVDCIQVDAEQVAFVALPEKALLDLVYLQPGGDDPAYLQSLRLQNLEQINPERLRALAARWRKPKLVRASQIILEMIGDESMAYEAL